MKDEPNPIDSYYTTELKAAGGMLRKRLTLMCCGKLEIHFHLTGILLLPVFPTIPRQHGRSPGHIGMHFVVIHGSDSLSSMMSNAQGLKSVTFIRRLSLLTPCTSCSLFSSLSETTSCHLLFLIVAKQCPMLDRDTRV
jgi:hypothetical protein